MLFTSMILFLLAALGGLVMAGIRFGRTTNPPAWLAMLHGLLAASGLTLLIYAVFTVPTPATARIALALFLLAASGGGILSLVYKWNNRLLPAWLVIAHASLAVLGFVCLLLAVFR